MTQKMVIFVLFTFTFGCDAKLNVESDLGISNDTSSDGSTDPISEKKDMAFRDVSDSKLDVRIEDATEDTSVDMEIVETATQYLTWNNGTDVRVVSPSGNSLDGYIRGGDFDQAIWAADDIWSWYMLHITEGGSPTEDFARVTIPTVTDRNGNPAKVLKMALLKDAPNTDVEQIEFLEQQSAGQAGDQDANYPGHTLIEPVFYQRQWIKFSAETLTRAQAIGSRDFYQIFWEMKAEPDYRLRVQMNYDDVDGLVVRAHDDVLRNVEPVHADSGRVKVGTIDMFGEEEAGGWNLFEVWIDRTLGDKSRWRVRFNGVDVLDYTGRLDGVSGNIMGTAMMVQIYSDVTNLSISPFSQMIDDIEIWNRPPQDAFK